MFQGRAPLAIPAFIATLALAQQVSPVPAIDSAHLASLDGLALGANALPLPGVKISLEHIGQQDPANRYHETTSDVFGKFSLQGLDPGQYTLTASHDGYEAFPLPLALQSGQLKAGVVITLTPLTVISGKVTDEAGAPMPGVIVQPLSPAFSPAGNLSIASNDSGVETDAAGEYRLELGHGRWYLKYSLAQHAAPARATGEPEQDYVVTYYPGVRDLSLASAIDLPDGLPLPALNMRLEKSPVYHVRGRVAGGGNAKLRIYASREAAEYNYVTRDDEGHPINSDATFDIAGLSPGTWTLWLIRSTEGFMAFPEIQRGQTVHIGDHDVDDVIITLQPPIRLSGSIRTVPESPTADSLHPNPPIIDEVRLVPLGPYNPPSGAPVQSDGAFAFVSVSPDRYRVDVTPPPGGFLKSVFFNGRECIDTGIDFNGEADASGLQLVIGSTAGTLTGAIASPDGAPPPRARVTLLPDGPPRSLYRPDLHPTVVADASGHFVVKNVVPGTYRVYAWERLTPPIESSDDGAPLFADPEFPRLFDSMSVLVTLGDSESKQISLTVISATKMEAESRRRR